MTSITGAVQSAEPYAMQQQGTTYSTRGLAIGGGVGVAAGALGSTLALAPATRGTVRGEGTILASLGVSLAVTSATIAGVRALDGSVSTQETAGLLAGIAAGAATGAALARHPFGAVPGGVTAMFGALAAHEIAQT